MTAKTFFEYLANTFYPWAKKKGIQFPIVVLVDGHRSHVTPPTVEFCRNHDIQLISLLPNATHVLQPWDVAGFGPLKAIWYKNLRQFKWNNNGDPITKLNFPPLLKKTVDEFVGLTQALTNGFKNCGLCPWDPNSVNYAILTGNEEPILDQKDKGKEEDEKISARDKLKCIESELTEEKKLQFESNRKSGIWEGPIEDTTLYNMWKSAKNKSEGINEMPSISPIEPDLSGTKANKNIKVEPTVESNDDPFKDAFIWPEVKSKTSSNKQRRATVPIPSVATSEKWRQHHENKEAIKQKEEETKKARQIERKRKAEERKNAKLVKKPKK
jgi:hypothetical protein